MGVGVVLSKEVSANKSGKKSLIMTRRHVHSRAYHQTYHKTGCKIAARRGGKLVVQKWLLSIAGGD